jgi:hypothetical protein
MPYLTYMGLRESRKLPPRIFVTELQAGDVGATPMPRGGKNSYLWSIESQKRSEIILLLVPGCGQGRSKLLLVPGCGQGRSKHTHGHLGIFIDEFRERCADLPGSKLLE